MGQMVATLRHLDVSQVPSLGASLLDRCESKYLLNAGQLDAVLRLLQRTGSLVQVKGLEVCHYETCYFDTSDDRSLHDAQLGVLPRWKVRCREYRQSGDRFLEAKLTTAEGVFKRRTPHTGASIDTLTEADLGFLKTVPELDPVTLDELRPVAVTAYDRRTFLVDGSRVTVDTDLVCRSGDVLLLAPGAVIVETKRQIGTPACEVDRHLLETGSVPGKFSKFSDARTLLTSGSLPAGAVPWQRFAPAAGAL